MYSFGLVLIVCGVVSQVAARPDGAPAAACVTMKPGHGVEPQAVDAVYTVKSNVTGEIKGPVKVTVEGGTFKGFLIQARKPGTTVPLGMFKKMGDEAKTMECTKKDSTITHTARTDKTSVEVLWMPMGDMDTKIEFVATVVQETLVFWTDLKSTEQQVKYRMHKKPKNSSSTPVLSVQLIVAMVMLASTKAALWAVEA